jgi:hypothetical protein
MNYRTGEPVKIGDSVSLEHGKTAGIVHALIESAEQISEWGLVEPGVIVAAEPFGLVFWPSSEINDPLTFIARKCT